MSQGLPVTFDGCEDPELGRTLYSLIADGMGNLDVGAPGASGDPWFALIIPEQADDPVLVAPAYLCYHGPEGFLYRDCESVEVGREKWEVMQAALGEESSPLP